MFAPRNSSPPLNCLSTNEHVAAYQVKIQVILMNRFVIQRMSIM